MEKNRVLTHSPILFDSPGTEVLVLRKNVTMATVVTLGHYSVHAASSGNTSPTAISPS